MWYFPEPVDDLNLVYRMDRWRQPAVDTKDLVIYDNTQRQEVEHIGKVMPDVGIPIFSRTLGIEAVRLCYTSRFVVASDQVDSVGVSELQADKERDRLDAEQAAVDIVACIGISRGVWVKYKGI